MVPKITLNNKAMEVYECLVEYITIHGYPPSIREIAEAVGLKSKCSVSIYLGKLEMAGLIEMDSSTARAIRLVGYKFVKEGEICQLSRTCIYHV